MLETKSEEISILLTTTDKLDAETIKRLNEIYEERKEAFDKLKKAMTKPGGKNIFDDEKLSERINKLMAKDKTNIEYLNRKISALKQKIRKLEKHKSALIYQRQ